MNTNARRLIAATLFLAPIAACAGDDGGTTPATTTALPAPTSPTPATPVPTDATTASVLPVPSGEQPVGVAELGIVGASTARVWYPAAAGTGTAATYDTPLLTALLGGPAPAAVRPHAQLDAEPAGPDGPLVVLTTGWASPLAVSTVLAEDLASHGAVVIGLEPLPGTENPASPPDAAAGSARVADIVAAVDLAAAGPLAAGVVAPTDTIVVGGHSFGGSSALDAALVDQRIDGVFDLDGSLVGSAAAGPAPVPTLLVAASTAFGGEITSLGTVLALTIEGEHYDVTDFPLIAPELGAAGDGIVVGPNAETTARTAVRVVQRFVEAVSGGDVDLATVVDGLPVTTAG